MTEIKDENRVVARRSFHRESGTEIIATVFLPVAKSPDLWTCSFTIEGLPEPIESTAPGVDGLQALEMALQGIRVHLEQIGEALTWLDGEPGYLGIARAIPDSFGVQIEKSLARLVEEELARLLEEDARAKGRPWPPGTPEH